MKTLSYTIKDEQGIHARPAGELVKAAKGDIRVRLRLVRAATW